MNGKLGSNRKSGSTRLRAGTDDKDRKVAGLENRIPVLENELQSWRDGSVSSVTERKRIEEELCRSRDELVEKSRYLDVFFNHTITPLVLLDRDFNFIRVNEAYARACQKEVDEFPGHNHFEFYPSDAREIFKDVICTRQPVRVDARPFVFADHPEWGVTYWNWTLTPLLDKSGEVEALVFALEDVTERKRAEIELERHRDQLQELVQERTRDLEAANEQLRNEVIDRKRNEEAQRESKTMLEAVFASMNDAVIIFDADGRATNANHAAAVFHRFASEDELLTSLNGYVELLDTRNLDGTRLTPESWPVKRALRGEMVFNRDIAVTRKDTGETWIANSSAAPIRNEDGNIVAAVVTMRDITERKRAEEALRESEEKFRALADNIPNMAWMADVDGSIFWFNKQWYDYTGTTLKEVRDWGWLKIHHPDYARKVKEKWLSSIEAGRQHENVAFIRGKDGNYRWFLTRVTPILDERGNVYRWFGTNTDITERKRAEDALRESEKNLAFELDVAQSLQQVSTRLIQAEKVDELYDQIIETAMKIMHADFASVQKCHPELKELELIGHRGFDPQAAKFWKWVRPASSSTCGMALRTGQRVAVPDVLKCDWMAGSDDLDMFLRTGIRAVQTTPLLSRSGVLLGMFSTHWREPHEMTMSEQHALDILARQAADLIDRKRADEALQESEQRFRATFEQAAVGIAQLDPGGHFIRINDRYCEIVGYTREEMQERTFREITYPDDLKENLRNIDRLLAGEIAMFTMEKRYVRKDGSPVWVNLTVSIERNEDRSPMYLIAVIEDITERRQAEESLRESEANLAMAQSIAHVGSYSLDIGPDRARCSDEFYLILGLEPQDHFSFRQFLAFVHPDDLELVDRKAREGWDRGKAYNIENRIVRPDGEVRVIYGEANMVVDETGRAVRMFGIIQDITERKQVEDALNEAKSMAELYVDLMGHDIRNMNQITMGFLEIAQQKLEYEGKLTMDDIYTLKKATESVENSTKLIENVRKIQRERLGEYASEMLDLGKMVENVAAQYGHVPGRSVNINCTTVPGSYVRANALLKDVFINLIGNAIKHSTGPIFVNVSMNSHFADGQVFWKVVVEDNGPGIPDTRKKTLFDRLCISDSRARGKGFGLCLIKLLIDDYKGKFWVEDRVPGDHTKGTRFVVMLPAVGD